MHPTDPPLRIDAGAPARVLGAAIPCLAVLLVAYGAARGAMDPSPDSPVSPWIVAVLTLAGSILLSWRALAQEAVLDDEGLSSRNLTSTLRLHWSVVEELRCVRRGGTVGVEIHLRGSRRHLRLGAATRWDGPQAELVLAALAGHPRAGALLVRDEP